MKKNVFYIVVLFVFFTLVGCNNHPIAQGQLYLDGQFSQPLTLSMPTLTTPINISDYVTQVALIKQRSPSLYAKNQRVYEAVEEWINQAMSSNQLNFVGLSSYQMAGQDDWGNVLLTGYYTPVITARHKPDNEFRYPLYKIPTNWQGRLPSRDKMYQGALAGKGLEIAYTNSLIDNFIMEVQGSGYIDFEDGEPLVFFCYGGKNGHRYQSIGRLLVEQGEIDKDKISMQAIKAWASLQSEQVVMELLAQNASVVFFKPQYNAKVIGAAGIPLVANASVAADRSLIPLGSVLLLDVPLLDANGQYKGEREIRLVVALDVGGAIKGQHFDVYQGIGSEAGELAGFYNHYGRAWLVTDIVK